MSIEIQGIVKRFGSFLALKGVNLQLEPGELLGLLGPSGSGKTTLLRIIGGLEFPDGGEVILHGEKVTDKLPADRNIGFVFQHYGLFRHMSVFHNVAFGLKVRNKADRPSPEAIRRKVLKLLKLVQLEGVEHRLPFQLSGGQRQRVALARALAIEPKVLLLDEPFGALDAQVRKDLRQWIRRLHQEIHVTSVFVTHDQDEALEVADRVVVMRQGAIEQIGTPDDVYNTPINRFVYNFLGRAVSLKGKLIDDNLQLCGRSFSIEEKLPQKNGEVVIFARPQDVRISPSYEGGVAIEVTIKDVNYAGPIVYLELERLDDGTLFQMEYPSESALGPHFSPSMRVFLTLKKYRIFMDGD